ncbi:SDR family oxidoreductase [Streptomyces caatingaensis]|uniref:SDR family oxidoreductase n=1 Tax=Streptomyces caatingaensis TaxID=1678637 RepID=UPI00067283DD|nr:SDR family oxidoreductase [Streptomyces caatingaensis]
MSYVVTGATGFYGSHFLAALLAARPRARVVALVRNDPAPARERLRAALEHTGRTLDDAALDRVTPVRIRLSTPYLGLGGPEYRALAADAEAVCHFAGHIGLTAHDRLRPTNVGGTAEVLRLAAAASPDVRVVHISTAYVAGARRRGTAPERIVPPEGGFLSPYEESKYEAECLVRAYCERHGRAALILRPGVLVTDRPYRPGLPNHPLGVLGAKAAELLRLSSRAGPDALFSPARPATARIPGSPRATLDLLQVPYAAEAAVELVTRVPPPPAGQAGVVHLVHARGTPVQTLLDALAGHLPGLDLTLSPDADRPTPLETLLLRMAQGAHLYTTLERDYERTALRRLLPHLPDPDVLDPGYLRRALAPPVRARSGTEPQR